MIGRKFYKSVVTVTVISEYPVEINNLAQLDRLITEGDCSGEIATEGCEEITSEEAVKALIAQGTDPTYFGLSEDELPVRGDEET